MDVFTILATDKRDIVEEVYKNIYKSNRVYVNTIIIILLLIMCATIMIYMVYPVWQVALHFMLVMSYRTLKESRKLSGIRVRSSPFIGIARIFKIVIMTNMPVNIKKRVRDMVYYVCMMQVEKQIERYMKTPNEIDKTMGKWKEYQFDPYWESLGLTKKEVMNKAVMVRMRTQTPTKQITINPPVMDTRRYLYDRVWIHRLAKNWDTSDMTDQMHVKSLYKRVLGDKEKFNISVQRQFITILKSLTRKMVFQEVSEKEAIIKALSSKGTAGQFAKRSDMEDVWKDKTSEISYDIWLKMTKLVRNIIVQTDEYPLSFVQYMLYRKKEPLPVEEGEIKVTRIMNAPHLVARVSDCLPFMPFNNALAESRWQMLQKVGMNIFVELKMILIYNPDYDVVLTDFKDYDGTQHPTQMLGCCAARMKYAYDNGQSAESMMYLLPRYMRHVRRNVKSTFGIEYETEGQLASGDITTTDDNSIKSEVQALMCNENLKKAAHRKGLNINEVNKLILTTALMSDDSARAIRRGIFEKTEIEEILSETAKSIGWKVKEGSYEQYRMTQSGDAYFLSHSIKRRWYAVENLKYKICIPIVVRERERAAGKWTIASEMEDDMSAENKAKLASKYLTTIMVSPGNPELMISSMYMLLWLRCGTAQFQGPYIWMGLQAKTIQSIDLSKILEMQTKTIFLITRFTSIEIDEIEEECIRYQIKQMNRLIDEYKIGNVISKKFNEYFKVDIIDGFWNYQATIRKLQTIMFELERNSQMKAKETHEKWWKDRLEMIEMPENRIRVSHCEHIMPKQVYAHEGYKVKLKCLNCWIEDKEQPDRTINICTIEKDLGKEKQGDN